MRAILFFSFFFSVALLFHSCEEDEIITPSYDKHNIQNDSCWVEITDTTNLDASCFLWEKEYDYKVINDNNTYINFQYHEDVCKSANFPTIDFNKKTLLAYVFLTNEYYLSFKIKFYRNDCINEYLFLVQISSPEDIWMYRFFQLGIIAPKIIDDYIVRFDTVFVK